MTSVLKAQKKNALKADAKGKGKRRADDMDVEDVATDAPAPKRRNKQRVLLLSSRGITHRMRHLMNDIEVLLPHTKKGASYYASCRRIGLTMIYHKTRSLIRRITCICYQNSQISTTAITLCILSPGVMKTCTCGQQKRRTGPV